MRRNGALAEIHPFILGRGMPPLEGMGLGSHGAKRSRDSPLWWEEVKLRKGEQRSLGSGAGHEGEDLPWAMGMRGQLWLG